MDIPDKKVGQIAGIAAAAVAIFVLFHVGWNGVFVDEFVQFVKNDGRAATFLTGFEFLYAIPYYFLSPVDYLPAVRAYRWVSVLVVYLVLGFGLRRARRDKDWATAQALWVMAATTWLLLYTGIARPTILAVAGTIMYCLDRGRSWRTGLGLLLCMSNPFPFAFFFLAAWFGRNWPLRRWILLFGPLGVLNAIPVMSQYYAAGTQELSQLYVLMLQEVDSFTRWPGLLSEPFNPVVLPSTLLVVAVLWVRRPARVNLPSRMPVWVYVGLFLSLFASGSFVMFRYLFPVYIWTILCLLPARLRQDPTRVRFYIAGHSLVVLLMLLVLPWSPYHWESPVRGKVEAPDMPSGPCAVLLDAESALGSLVSVEAALRGGYWGILSGHAPDHCSVHFAPPWDKIWFARVPDGTVRILVPQTLPDLCIPTTRIYVDANLNPHWQDWNVGDACHGDYKGLRQQMP